MSVDECGESADSEDGGRSGGDEAAASCASASPVDVDARPDPGEQVGGRVDVGAGVVEGVGEEAFEAAGHRSSSISAVRSGTWRSDARPRLRWVFTELGDTPSVSAISATGQLEQVVQREAVALAAGECPQRGDDALVIVAGGDGLVDAGGVEVDGPLGVLQRQQAASVVVTGQVQHDRAQVRGRLGRVVDAMQGSRQADECLLDDVFGRVAVIDEEPGQTDE